jgi:DNA-binding MarR family transcriptional regulator
MIFVVNIWVEKEFPMPKSNPVPLDGQLCFSLYATSIAINRLYKPMLDEFGITYPQYLVLSALWEGDGQTITAIADRLALEPSTITPLVKRLEVAALVTRARNAEDERKVQVFLTAKGKGLRAETTCLTDALLRNSGMSVKQLVDLNGQVQALRKALTGAH